MRILICCACVIRLWKASQETNNPVAHLAAGTRQKGIRSWGGVFAVHLHMSYSRM